MKIKQVHCLISGHVQGVCYRVSAREQATALGLVGWVQNLPDGRVELLIEGKADAIQAMLDWAHQGPSLARVSHIDARESAVTGEFTAFHIR